MTWQVFQKLADASTPSGVRAMLPSVMFRATLTSRIQEVLSEYLMAVLRLLSELQHLACSLSSY